MLEKCQSCNEPIESDWSVCPSCGKLLVEESKNNKKTSVVQQIDTQVCLKCNKPLKQEWVICPYCRTRTTESKALLKSNRFMDAREEVVPRSFKSQEPMQQIPTQFVQGRAINLDGVFTRPNLLIGIATGLVLMLLGAVIVNISTVTDDDADSEDLATAQKTHQNGAIIYNIGVFFIVGILLCAALVNDELNQFVRLGMLIAAGLIGFHLFGA